MKDRPEILVVDDDPNISRLEQLYLEKENYEVRTAADGNAAIAEFRRLPPDLILLDVMLPGVDGYEVLKTVRRSGNIPVIMVTAKEAEYDKVRGLDSGADDYITKPFGMMEFISRVKAVLRRSKKQMKDTLLSCGNLSIDVERHQVLDGERQVELTYKEFEMLSMLMSNPGRVFTRQQFLTCIWDQDYDGETRTVDVHIRNLRQKLGECGNYINTVRGVGYRMEVTQ